MQAVTPTAAQITELLFLSDLDYACCSASCSERQSEMCRWEWHSMQLNFYQSLHILFIQQGLLSLHFITKLHIKKKTQTPTHQLNKFIHPSRGTRLTGGVTLHSTARLLQQWSSRWAPPTPETICCSEKMSKTCMPQKIHSRPVQLIFVCRSDCNTRKSFLLVSSCTIRSFAHRYILGSRRFLSRC